MSKQKSQSDTETLCAAHRRSVLVEILSEAACRLAGISVNSPKSSGICQERADS